jgi:hypothetical protein
MKRFDKKQKNLLKMIVEIELNMFQKVRTLEPSLCQERPDTFKNMREMGHSVLSHETLRSYYKDLKNAKKNNRNLLTEKYARINNLIPPLKNTSLISDILTAEDLWMKELSQKYPFTFKKSSPYFNIYLSCELETYSDETLNLYLRDITKAVAENKNLAQERFLFLFKKLGYNSISEVEKKHMLKHDI